MGQPDCTRRSFLVASAAMPVLGSIAHGYPANETISVGVIGSGGRARHLMKSLVKIPNVRIASVCDVWDVALAEGRKLADPQAMATKKYREVLDNKEIQAVLIGTPDHWHVPLTVAACQAGKDVYVEKPLTHDLKEGQAVIAAQNQHKRIVQVGTQQRSMPHIQKGKELIAAGKLGQVIKVTMSWNRNTNRVQRFPLGVKPEQVDWKAFLGNAPDQPFDEYRMRNWRWYWDFGGGLFTDLMVHWVDVAHWLLDLDHPSQAVSVGQFHAAKGIWETPDTVQTLLTYANGVQMHYEGTFSNARRGAHIEFMGTDATLYIDRGRYVLTPERGKPVQPDELILGKTPAYPGADFYDQPDGELLHLTNWIDCIRSRAKPTAPAEAGVSSASAAHLANLALRGDGLAKWQ